MNVTERNDCMKEWCLEVWGDYACFTRPEMKVERVSYDVPTPSAARAIFEAILWKPAIRWNVLRIEVMKPIRWVSVRRNEVGKKFTNPTAAMLRGEETKPFGLFVEEARRQRAGLFLRDVRYRIWARFDYIPVEQRQYNRATNPEFWADNEEEHGYTNSHESDAKYAAMFERRATKGQCFHRPYLGCREFACHFRLNSDKKDSAINENRDLGWMLYDMDFSDIGDIKPLFFRASIKEGVVLTDRNRMEVRG